MLRPEDSAPTTSPSCHLHNQRRGWLLFWSFMYDRILGAAPARPLRRESSSLYRTRGDRNYNWSVGRAVKSVVGKMWIIFLNPAVEEDTCCDTILRLADGKMLTCRSERYPFFRKWDQHWVCVSVGVVRVVAEADIEMLRISVGPLLTITHCTCYESTSNKCFLSRCQSGCRSQRQQWQAK